MEFLTKIFIALLVGGPALIWLAIYYCSDTKPEKLKLIRLTFLTGLISILPLLVIKFWVTGYNIIHLIVIGAILEEIFKLWPTAWIMNKFPSAHDEVTDGIIYAVCVALGYSLSENLYVLWDTVRDITLTGPLLAGIAYRSI